jgi:nucleoside-diphosphate-sugar epimerase
MRILIVGGTNFIGPQVVRRLAESGNEVVVFHRGRTEAGLPAGVGRILGDRKDLGNVAGEFRRFAPEVVLDMIPMNQAEARDLVDVFRGICRRVVAVSSQDVYRAYDRVTGRDPGPPDPVPLSEDAPLREKLYPYEREGVEDYEKILVERVVMGAPDLPGTALRLPAVYGPGDYQHRLFGYLKRMDDARPAILLGEGMASWRWTHGYVEDVALAIALAVTDERAAGHVYNVGEADPPPWAEWVRGIGRAAGWGGEVVIVPDDRLPQHLDWGLDTEQCWVADTTRIRRELGYREEISREEALRRTVEWERAHPPENVDPASFDYASEEAALADCCSYASGT